MSDVALHKICRKHDIPHPPLGWWAKKAAGREVSRTPLPGGRSGPSEKITIAGGQLNRESKTLAQVREQARIAATRSETSQAAPGHPVIDRTIARLIKQKPSERGLLSTDEAGLIRCDVAFPSIDRLAFCLPRIVAAASLQGFELASRDGPAVFRSATEEVGFSITEAVRRDNHSLTEAEQAKLEAWQRKRERAARRDTWHLQIFDQPRFPEWDYHPTGRLCFEFEQVWLCGAASPRRSFRDAKVQRLETMAGEIAVGLAVLAAAKTEERIRCEAEERKQEAARLARERDARAKFIESRRRAALGEVLSEIDELARLRDLISMVSQHEPQADMPRLSAFLTWATEQAVSMEARLTTDALEARFDREHLFGGDDDREYGSRRTW